MFEEGFIQHLQAQLSNRLGQSIRLLHADAVQGGDINESWHVHTTAGSYFLKTNSEAGLQMFAKEFNGLNLLKSAACIAVPEPILYAQCENTAYLLMAYIEKNIPAKDFWKRFAVSLACLHRQSHEMFGLHEDNFIGTICQPNQQNTNWTDFYTHQRILPLMTLACKQNKCTKDDIYIAEKFCSKLPQLMPDEPPALLHGDLWSGNFMAGEQGLPVIYDPAVYYGHREMDISMTLLFGGFDKDFYNHYNDIFPLQQSWQKRVDICHLYPLLVHLVLFGGHYYYSSMNILKKYAG